MHNNNDTGPRIPDQLLVRELISLNATLSASQHRARCMFNALLDAMICANHEDDLDEHLLALGHALFDEN
ncbi:MAG: hypothetical protein JWP75_3043 [Frondihabitans sp.]|nr:hypothetical protein [Frondihabitans sp.]